MEATFKNQNYFQGFINGIIAMYKLGNNLDSNLNMSWGIKFIDSSKANIFCEYSSSVRNVLTNPGDEDFAPDYKVIDIRETMNVKIDDIEDLEHVTMQVIEILDELSLVKDIELYC